MFHVKRFLVSLFTAIALYISVCNAAPAYEYVVETYTVQATDTLDSITDVYIVKNTYGEREHNEFKQGIIELNEFLWERKDCKLVVGEQLKIAYWKKI